MTAEPPTCSLIESPRANVRSGHLVVSGEAIAKAERATSALSLPLWYAGRFAVSGRQRSGTERESLASDSRSSLADTKPEPKLALLLLSGLAFMRGWHYL